MDRAARSLMCVFGAGCKHGLNCHRGHTDVHKKMFADKKEIREKEWMAPCGFCAVGRCRYGAECQRSIRSRLSNETYRKQRAPAESESDYASADSGSDSGDDSTDEAGMARSEGSGAEGAVSDRALTPFLSEDFTEVVKGWRPNVGAAAADYRGFGEPPIFWILQVLPVSPGSGNGDRSDVDDRCVVDAVDFVFNQSEGAVMSQKARRRIAGQKKVEVVWAGPAVVHEQCAVSRVSIGHRGARMRKVLFDGSDSDEGSNDGGNDGRVGATEGGCNRRDKAARNRLWVIRRDKKEVGMKAERKAEAARLAAAAVKVQSTGGRYADKSRGWLALQICHCICESASQRCKMRIYVQQWAAEFRAGIRAAKLEVFSGAGPAAESVKCRRFIRMFARRRDPGDIYRRVYTRELFVIMQRTGLVPITDTPKTECGAVVQSAGTVLRTVMLFRSLESFVRTCELWAVDRAFHGVFCNWECWWRRLFRLRDSLEVIGLKLWVDYACWLYCDVFPRWRGAILFRKCIRRMQRVVVNLKIRGATRQWLTSTESAAQVDRAEAESAAEAIKIKAAAMVKAMGAMKAKAADEWTLADRGHKSRWNSVVCRLCEMMDILAEIAECRMQKLE